MLGIERSSSRRDANTINNRVSATALLLAQTYPHPRPSPPLPCSRAPTCLTPQTDTISLGLLTRDTNRRVSATALLLVQPYPYPCLSSLTCSYRVVPPPQTTILSLRQMMPDKILFAMVLIGLRVRFSLFHPLPG